MSRPSFPESVAFERGNEPLREPFDGASNVIRRRLLHGEDLSAEQVAELTGKTPGLLGAAMKMMKNWGFEFQKVLRDDGTAAWRLTNPEHVPTDRDPSALRPRHPRGEVARARSPRTTPSDLMPPPQLDQDLKVYMVFRDPDDGHVKFAVRNGTNSWVARVEGHVKLSDFGDLV